MGTTLLWIGGILAAAWIVGYAADLHDRREKRKRIERLIERRQYLDQVEPRPWHR